MTATLKRKPEREKMQGRMEPAHPLSSLCSELQELQRRRVCTLKSRIMLENRLVATVATFNGYHAGQDEDERTKRFDEARKHIKQALAGEIESNLAELIQSSHAGSDGFDKTVEALEKEMAKRAKQLPIAKWVDQPAQRGFGILSLVIVVGECGDLNNYAGPAKVWRRMGCAPFESGGKTLMGATWKAGKEGKLSAGEWEEYGYSPRRRSIAYLFGENIVKQNGTGPYRKRYDQAKEDAAKNHPDWKPLRCHRHGMLLATKLLLKNLWIEWNK